MVDYQMKIPFFVRFRISLKKLTFNFPRNNVRFHPFCQFFKFKFLWNNVRF